MEKTYDVIIIGGGVSGFAAAMYAGRFELKTLVIGDTLGGVIITTNEVANYPGFKMVTGIELADKIREHALEYKVDVDTAFTTKCEKTKEGFKVSTSEKSYLGKTVILATGTKWRKLKVPGEEDFANKGVHYCALCDGAFYKDKVVALVGGSDSAAKDALVLTQYAKKVFIIYRGKQIHPEPINLRRVEQNKKIEVINETNVKEIKGEKFVNKLILDKPYKGSEEFAVDAVFIAIGHEPLNELAKQLGVKLNGKGEIIIDRHGFTNVEGVYAAGDIVNTEFKQAITGVAEGVTASFNAYNHLQKQKEK
ncbi:FAD-dependent oxidoreductase [Candidatus Woesearchaeota archaeon]|nr:FAD-dependent oxidoreductase [Candidatus Woesearchaeota archaeon]